ncbi:L-serine ammonia-lyase, iron-sulfur-dependent, subunit beta [Pseudothermotoga thermarum]|uniref:L-serine ammonia-lyase n=1 Tax=Pseudothermotoga thermarum DSM 5069 TaxID=688269 RepID=F7YXG3_9THEM|nr:L-serine ammonia-lyase, iron-sulfur-dependent, subunit alpha [Pseudothermotoga thermarum]AEH51937.1 L-serine ammonia-lyase [Pseudothermotoga thermarum DSM 5069]
MKFAELIGLSKKSQQPFHEVILINQMMEEGLDPLELSQKLKRLVITILDLCEKNFGKPSKSLTGMVQNAAYTFSNHQPLMMGKFNYIATVAALSMAESNASMGKIVACPTAGSCGVLPGVLYALWKVFSADVDDVTNAFIVAGEVGNRIASVASISGAIAGCQAEIGAAAAMASSALTYYFTLDPDKVAHAAALTLKSLMGLVCDPIGGFVEVPCIKRNATAVNLAIATAEMAIAGIQSVIPFDEVVEALSKVGRSLPEELRETGLGGIAATKTAQLLVEKIRGDQGEIFPEYGDN